MALVFLQARPSLKQGLAVGCHPRSNRRRRHEFWKLFSLSRECLQRRVFGRNDDFGQHHLRESPGDGGGNAGLSDGLAASIQRLAAQLEIQGRVGREQLTSDSIEPRRMPLLHWP